MTPILRTLRSAMLLTALLTAFAAQSQTPFITLREGMPDQDITVRQVVHGNGVFVACLIRPTRLYTSRDGVNWAEIAGPPSSATDGFSSLAFGAGRFVVTETGGRMFSSTDLSTWTLSDAGTTQTIEAIKYLHGGFYAVGDSATFLFSPDGVAWEKRAIGIGDTTDTYTNVLYGNGHLLITADVPHTVYDSSAGGWTADSSHQFTHMGFARGRFYLFTVDSSLASTDLRHWSPISTAPDAGGGTDVFEDDRYVYLLSGGYDTVNATPLFDARLSRAADGVHFGATSHTMVTGGGDAAYYNHRYFVFGVSGAGPMAGSADGVHYRVLGSTAQYLATNGRAYVKLSTAADGAYLYRSTDLSNWTLTDTVSGVAGLIYDGSQFRAVGSNVYTSTDGRTWTDKGASGHPFSGIAFGNGTYIAWSPTGFGGNDSLWYSADGANWMLSNIETTVQGPFQPPTPDSYGSVQRTRFLDGHIFVVGNANIMFSTDGSYFQQVHLGTYLTDVAHDSTTFHFFANGLNFSPSSYPITITLADPYVNNGYNPTFDTVNGLPAGVQLNVFDDLTNVGYSNGHYASAVNDYTPSNYATSYLVWSADAVHWDIWKMDRETQFTDVLGLGDTLAIEGTHNYEILVSFAPPHSNIINFRAVDENNTRVLLDWETTSEVGSRRFVVQRLDAQIWDSIGVVAAAGNNSGFLRYGFTDDSPLPGDNYYRLRLVNIDNSTQLSETRHVYILKPSDFVAYPNPFNDWITVQRPASEDKGLPEATVMLYDCTGRLVLEKVLTGTSLTLETGHLAFGLYQLVIRETRGVVYHKEMLHFW